MRTIDKNHQNDVISIFLFSRLLNKFHPLQKPNNIFQKYVETKIFWYDMLSDRQRERKPNHKPYFASKIFI